MWLSKALTLQRAAEQEGTAADMGVTTIGGGSASVMTRGEQRDLEVFVVLRGDGTITVEGDVSLKGDADVEGNVSIVGNLEVRGNVKLQGAVEISGSLTINGEPYRPCRCGM